MNVLQKSVIPLLTFASSMVFAGTMGPVCKEGNVTIPCPQNAWELGADALYLHANYTNGGSTGTYFNNGVEKWNIPDPGWGWGFRLHGAFYYDEGSDLNLNWSHINFTNHAAIPYSSTTGVNVLVNQTTQPRWDAINGELGQIVHFGKHKTIRFHGGAQFAQIVSNFKFPSASFPTESTYMKFYGFGPRIGADLKYHWQQGFAIYANAATALLVGGTKFDTTSSGLLEPTVFPVSYLPYSTTVIPELEGKLGVSYTYVLPLGHITIEGGYWWLDYIHAQANDFQGNEQSADFTLNGPYFGFKWLG